MTESVTRTSAQKQFLDEIINRKKLRNFYFESSVPQVSEENDVPPNTPEVVANSAPPLMTNERVSVDSENRRRANSQPGPSSGPMVTATAARAARKRIPRAVNYAVNLELDDNYMDKTDQKGPNFSQIAATTMTVAQSSKQHLDRGQPLKLYLPKGGDDSGTATPIGDRDRSSPFSTVYNNYKNGDVKSLNSYRLYTSTLNGGVNPRKRSLSATMDAQSIRSIETHAPPPTSPEDNKNLTRKYITLIFSTMYAVLLVTLGLLIYLSNPYIGGNLSLIYSMILLVIGFIYHVYLLVDINRYIKIAKKNDKLRSKFEDKLTNFLKSQEDGLNMDLSDEQTPSDRKPEVEQPVPPSLIPFQHDYCFSQGRHSGSFYLKLGATAFAIGHLVHSMLLVTVELELWLDENVSNDDCVNLVQLCFDILNPIYCFLQLYLVYKYSNVIVLKNQGIAFVAFMHIIGSCICFWIYTIVRETTLSLVIYAHNKDKEDYKESSEELIRSEDSTTADVLFQSQFESLPSNISKIFTYDEKCMGSLAVTAILESFSPYLYPFSVEFNILIVAVYYIIWNNIGSCTNEDTNSEPGASSVDYSLCKAPTANEENDFTSNIVIHADCHASNRGLFIGLIVAVIVGGMLILAFVFIRVGEEFLTVGYLMNDITKLSLHIIMLFAAILAFTQTIKLDINEHPISLLDDILLYVSLPPFFMEAVLSLVATVSILNIVRSIDFAVMVIQVLIQTPLIMDGLRRCSNTRKLRRTKPGRSVIMFLLIANVSMWLFYTFSYKAPERYDERYEFYGKVLWSILGHISLPLIMFYRFHSSVCFADIWVSAYKPGSEH